MRTYDDQWKLATPPEYEQDDPLLTEEQEMENDTDRLQQRLGDADYAELVIPADMPTHAAVWLRWLDAAIIDRSLAMYGICDDASRLATANWMHAHSGASSQMAFFLWNYIRLLEGQAAARATNDRIDVANKASMNASAK